ncbi:MAG: hypothetical protein HY360_06490 [Verrucomicrobia bacterium]|nr:hypothetical protein [Verrucomicrobiota bacterium]
MKSHLREILVVHHTHTDWGYTAHPRVVEEQHHRFIFRYRMKHWPKPVNPGEAVRFCESDPLADYPQIIRSV